MPGHEQPQPNEATLEERRHLWNRFHELRTANWTAYLATSEEQFTTPVGGDIADQRTYLKHQIQHSFDRFRAFGVRYPGIDAEYDEYDKDKEHEYDKNGRDSEGYTERQRLIGALARVTGNLYRLFEDQANWEKKVSVPYAGEQTGEKVIRAMITHEAHHEGMNRVTLGHFGIPLPAAVIRPFGK